MSDKMTPIKLNQLKKASEAYAELRTLHTDPLTEEVDGNFPAWSIFRDEFIADWTSNRIIVDEKEADAMFDTLVDNAIQEIEAAEATADAALPTETIGTETVGAAGSNVVVMGDAPAAKRRGRPPGSGKKATETTAPKKSYYVPVAQRKVKATKATKATKVTKTKKVAAKKKSASSASSKAQTLVERYVSRKWERKDIIAKLQDQLGMGAAYAASLYQKFA